VKRATISISSGTSQDIVAAVTGYRIRVLNIALLSDTAGTFTFKSNTTGITGAMPVAANGGFVASDGAQSLEGPRGLFETASGEKLNLTFSTSANVGGFLTYILVYGG